MHSTSWLELKNLSSPVSCNWECSPEPESWRLESLVSFLSLVPRPCAFVACSTKFACRRPGLVHHVICAAAYVTAILLRINDVIGCASTAFYSERGSQRTVHVEEHQDSCSPASIYHSNDVRWMWSRQWGLSITRTLVFWLDLSAPPLVRTNLCLRQSVSHVAVSLPSHDIVVSFSSLSVRNFFNCTYWQLVEYGRLQCIHALKQNSMIVTDIPKTPAFCGLGPQFPWQTRLPTNSLTKPAL